MSTQPTGTEARVCADIAGRQALGIKKYGKTVEENPLTRRQWVEHAYEECLDMAVYLRRLMEEEDKEREHNPRPNRAEVEEGIAAGRAWRWKYKDGGRWSNWFDSSHIPTWLEGLEYELAPIEPSTSLDEDVVRRIRDTEYTRL